MNVPPFLARYSHDWKKLLSGRIMVAEFSVAVYPPSGVIATVPTAVKFPDTLGLPLVELMLLFA